MRPANCGVRQLASLLFERLAKSRNKERVLDLARRGHELDGPSDVLKNPFVLEFLGLHERSEWRERELEQAIIDREAEKRRIKDAAVANVKRYLGARGIRVLAEVFVGIVFS